jgi:hypothetical protein
MTDSNSERSSSIRTLVPPLVLILGCFLIAVSLIWPFSSTNHTGWSPEQAKQYQAASVKLHSLSHAAMHPTPDTDLKAQRKELEQAQEDYSAIRSQLDSAIAWPRQVAITMRIGGTLLGAIGAYLLFPKRATS